jgi:hypothetical protein
MRKRLQKAKALSYVSKPPTLITAAQLKRALLTVIAQHNNSTLGRESGRVARGPAGLTENAVPTIEQIRAYWDSFGSQRKPLAKRTNKATRTKGD